jgi:hypothetical protein
VKEEEMNDLDTREAVRALANMVRTLAVFNQHLNRNGVALLAALEKVHPGVRDAYIAEAETPLSMPEADRLLNNIDALLRQLEKV